MKYLYGVLGITLMTACSNDNDEQYALEMVWSLDSIAVEPTPRSYATFRVINSGSADLGQNWEIFYNQFHGVPDPESVPDGIEFSKVSGTFLTMKPSGSFTSLAPGESRQFHVEYWGNIDRTSSGPAGVYAVVDEQVIPIERELSGFDDQTLAALNLPSSTTRFEANASSPRMERNELALVPTPVSFALGDRMTTISGKITIGFSTGLGNEADHLAHALKRVFTGTIEVIENASSAPFYLALDESMAPDAYTLVIRNGAGQITGSPSGVFYGIQSLKRILPASPGNATLTMRELQIDDAPRFPYRGLHFDVARNFHQLDEVKRIIDLLAFYKLNKLHLTLTNDEGWRLEIPSLPELTDIGSKRGHTRDESDRLYPAYGSGPFSEPGSAGTGYYTRQEYIDLLRYAAARHIEIIPEIDMPGHARAPIVAMRARYNSLMQNVDETGAREYLLEDFDDESEYQSAQQYNDNVMCVCQESTYRFIEKVIDEVVKMHEEAGVELRALHCGGDEVPYGAWQKSPVCAEFIANNDKIQHTDQLFAYFIDRLSVILQSHNLITAGWEELALQSDAAGHNTTAINYDFLDDDFLLYVWNSVWGWGREDMAYKLANSGYKIVMCNSSALYFDLGYNRDPLETGLNWSGYVDTRTAFEFAPYDIFTAAKTDIAGNPLNKAYVASKVRLDPAARENVLGIQGQLWGETLVSSDLLDYYLFPKLLGLAQRAWSSAPAWASTVDDEQRFSQIDADWGIFANTVGQVELPALDHIASGVQYRIPLPGARIEHGMLEANVRYPGLELRYTTDGSEPTSHSPLYEGPVAVGEEVVRLKAFNSVGRSSRTAIISRVDR